MILVVPTDEVGSIQIFPPTKELSENREEIHFSSFQSRPSNVKRKRKTRENSAHFYDTENRIQHACFSQNWGSPHRSFMSLSALTKYSNLRMIFIVHVKY